MIQHPCFPKTIQNFHSSDHRIVLHFASVHFKSTLVQGRQHFFLDHVHLRLLLCTIKFQTAFVDRTANCVHRLWFLEVSLSPFTLMLLTQLVQFSITFFSILLFLPSQLFQTCYKIHPNIKWSNICMPEFKHLTCFLCYVWVYMICKSLHFFFTHYSASHFLGRIGVLIQINFGGF